MHIRFSQIVFLACAVLMSCIAVGQVRGPDLGFIFQQGGIRPIVGIPGSSLTGDLLPVGRDLTSVKLSPRHEYALATSSIDAGTILIDLRSAAVTVQPIAGLAEKPDRIVMSPTGSSAALLFSPSHVVEVLTGLPDSPQLHAEFDVSSLLESATAMALSDDGETVLLGIWDGELGSLYSLEQGSAVFVSHFGRISSITFLRGSRDAFLADQSNSEILLIHNVWGGVAVLAGARDGVTQPTVLGVSDKGRRVFAADSDAGIIFVVSTTGSAPTVISCACSISGLHPLKGDSVFRLTEPENGPVLILDGASEQPQMYFIPGAQR